MNIKIRTGDWVWVLYPITVMVFMIVGLNYLLSSGKASISGFTINQQEIEAEQQRITSLESKLNILKSIDPEETRMQLEQMLEAVPPSRQVWLLINELKFIGQQSGLFLENYKGQIGDVKEASESAQPATTSAVVADNSLMALAVEYKLSGISDLARALGMAEKLMPLIKIESIDYSRNMVKIKVQGAWSVWPPANNNPELELNFDQVQVNRTLNRLSEFQKADMVFLAEPATDEATF